jgi:ectoine hydroxylase-related dioxygenase (phytanoyl-CoA dioxygenase family)
MLSREMNRLNEAFERNGFAIIAEVFSESNVTDLLSHIQTASLKRSRAGIRHALAVPAIETLARNTKLLTLASSVLGKSATPYRATLFDKSANSNWLVAWHQDTALPFRERRERHGWGPWSRKAGVHYAIAPPWALERVVALRVHLDDSTLENGPLRVLPGTHTWGVLTDHQLQQAAADSSAVECVVGKGGILAMRPLIVHASSKSRSDLPRRVLHIEYAACRFFENEMELAFA